MAEYVDTKLTQVIENEMTLARYKELEKAGLIDPNQKYFLTDAGGKSWELLREITITEDTRLVTCYTHADDGDITELLIEMIAPSVASWQNVRCYLGSQFANATRYFANLPYYAHIQLLPNGKWRQDWMIPSAANITSYAGTGVGNYGQILDGELVKVNMTLYSGYYPAGTTFKVYKKL